MPALRTAREPNAAVGWSQDMQRSAALYYDQHRSPKFPDGRPWWSYSVERPALQEGIKTDMRAMPVGELNADGWEAPWYPEQKYFRYSQGVLQDFRVRIDYVAMKNDYTAATRTYYERAVKEAATLSMPLPTYNSVIPWELQQVVGPAPKSPKIPEAAMAGDLWLLFGEGDENEELARLLTMGTEWVPTPEQSLAKADELALVKAQLAEQARQFAELKAMLASKSPADGATADPTQNAIYHAFVRQQVGMGKTKDEAIELWRQLKASAA
jgi:hypothetical protein